MKKKTTPAPTLTERLDSATADLADALSVFESVSERLGAAAVAHDQIADEVSLEIARLQAVKSLAQVQAARAGSVQVKVRDLLS